MAGLSLPIARARTRWRWPRDASGIRAMCAVLLQWELKVLQVDLFTFIAQMPKKPGQRARARAPCAPGGDEGVGPPLPDRGAPSSSPEHHRR